MEAFLSFLKEYIRPGIWVYVAGVMFFSACLFLPDSAKDQTGIRELSQEYRGYAGIGFWLSVALLAASFLSYSASFTHKTIAMKYASWKLQRKYKRLSTRAKIIVSIVHFRHMDTIPLKTTFSPTIELVNIGFLTPLEQQQERYVYMVNHNWKLWMLKNGEQLAKSMDAFGQSKIGETLGEM